MQYTDELADEIIAKFHLDPKTKRVWKNRNAIPDKYQDAEYSPPVSSQHNTDVMRMREIFALPEIANTKFQFGKRASDIKDGQARITEEEIIQFKTEITQLRNKLRDGKDRNIFKPLLQDTRIHPTKLLPIALYKRIVEGKVVITDSEKQEARLLFLRLYNLIRL